MSKTVPYENATSGKKAREEHMTAKPVPEKSHRNRLRLCGRVWRRECRINVTASPT